MAISLLPHLASNADIITIAYGSAHGGEKQESPAYLLQYAQQHPNAQVEILHYDPNFEDIGRNSYCATSKDWEAVSTSVDRHVFQHKKYNNFKVSLINSSFPHSTEEHSVRRLHAFCLEKLQQNKHIFFAVHNHSWEDICKTMSVVHNVLHRQFPNKVHLYIQAGTGNASIYSKHHSNILGLFGFEQRMKTHNNCCDDGSLNFENAFSNRPFTAAVKKTREVMQDFLEQGPDVSRYAVQYQQEVQDTVRLEKEHLLAYLDHPETHSLKIMPMEQVSLATFGLGPSAPRSFCEVVLDVVNAITSIVGIVIATIAYVLSFAQWDAARECMQTRWEFLQYFAQSFCDGA